MRQVESVVANHPSGFFALAAAPRQPLVVAAWPTSPRKTRVGVFRHRSSGQTSSRRRCRSINTPGSRGCGYKTVSGRHEWLNRDPIQELGGLNLYGYVANNPINAIDPLGLWHITIGIGLDFGLLISFGNNGGSNWHNGQWSFGAYVGEGEGGYLEWDPNNKPTGNPDCNTPRFIPGARLKTGVGLGDNVELNGELNDDSGDWDGSLSLDYTIPNQFLTESKSLVTREVSVEPQTVSLGTFEFGGVGGTYNFGDSLR